MTGWAREALRALGDGRPAALVTVLATEGSAPREAGARMVVTRDTLCGTVGGGALEHQLTRQARAVLDQPPGTWRVQDYPLGPLLGQCCGGRVRVMIERLDPARDAWLEGVAQGLVQAMSMRLEAAGPVRTAARGGSTPAARGPMPEVGDVLAEAVRPPAPLVVIFGAGHVGQALRHALAPLPFAVQTLDVRPDLAGQAEIIDEGQMLARIGSAGVDAVLLIMTHDHALDYRLAAAALRSRAGFVGLIGSRSKRARFISRLRAEGLGDEAQTRLVCPIGLAGIGGKEPAVIAASVAAQLLARRGRP